INEWGSIKEAQQGIDKWICNYNYFYPHSMLNDLSPVEFEQLYTKQKAA
ncbi:MAG: transposase, partial [Candidatus Helarchaeota archaeon]|nr:transposase [Candidatus Helarchaeota archaeon]